MPKSTEPVVQQGQSLRPTRVRFFILALVASCTMINYLDRTVISIAAPSLSKELRLDPAVLGIVFSAFSWTYAVAQVPGGILLDRFGTKLIYFISVTFWSLCTLLQSAVTGLYSLLSLRLGLGLFEAPCFPANGRIVAVWFPQNERARATSVYTVGEYVGLAFLSPILFWIVAQFGWRALFIVVGGIGILFGLAWWFGYREPSHSRRVNSAELSYIAAGGGLAAAKTGSTTFSWQLIGKLLTKRQMWGACLGQFGGNSTLVFFLTWFPTYLADQRHMPWVKAGFLAVLPFLGASLGVLAGGWWSDRLLKRTGSANLARKLPIITGLLLASTIIAANYCDNNIVIILIMSVAFFAQGMTGLGWTVISDIAPKNLMGLTGGVFNFAANLAGIITPMVIGFVVHATGSFVGALAYIASVGLLGAFSYIFILGDVRRIEL
jgi:MFS transporter, ACS family, D-galactonate transporter